MLGALALALLSAGLLLRSEARAASAEHRWGTLSSVVVARHDLRAGTELGAHRFDCAAFPPPRWHPMR